MMPDRPIIFSALEWLLGLDQIRLGRDAPIYLRWNSPYPGWFILAFSLVVLLFIAFAYRREPGRSGRRIVLTGLRAALAGLVIALLCRPVLILQRNRVSPSHVALLLDTSASMSQVDRPTESADEPPGRRASRRVYPGAHTTAGVNPAARLASRLDLVRRALTANHAEPLRALLRRNDLRLYHFAAEARPIDTVPRLDAPPAEGGAPDPETPDLDRTLAQLAHLTADGTSTDLARSLEQVLSRTEGGHLAALILASDGRSTEPTPIAEAIAAAQAQQIPIYPLLVGSPVPQPDVGIESGTADGNVFAKDILAVRARLQASGLSAPTPVTVQLVDEELERVVASQTIEIGGVNDAAGPAGTTPQRAGETPGLVEVELRTKPARAGRLRYRIQVVPPDGDADADNNAEVVEVWVRDEPARVLYVEQQPRYEYRYLKNALVREDTVRAGILLLSADAEFAQEGTDPIRRFPETPEEFQGYDVVLFGDVDPTGDWLTSAQAQMLVNFVGQRGGGFGLIAGERHAPHRFRGTVLEKLIPVRIDPDFLGAYAETLTAAFVPRVTPEGERSRLFHFDVGRPPPDGTAPSLTHGELTSIVSTLPGWYWFARTLGPRPGAEVLLEHPTVQTDTGPMPLVVVGRYGAGKVLFQASDDTWRWRRGAGELVYDGYWIQVVRALVPTREPDADHRWVVRPKKRQYRYGERVEVQVQVRDAALLTGLEDEVRLIVRDQEGQPVAQVDAKRLGGMSPLFEGSFIPPGVGTFSFSIEGQPSGVGPAFQPVGPAFQPVGPAASFHVKQASLEFRRPEADHATLERLAAETGGELVAPDRLTEVFAQLRDRSVRIPDDVSEPLWDSRLAFILFAFLITCEWILRKVYGMI
ncbi:MAG: hypothetical protein V2A79_05995 [Planctomycetota bacterium]